MIAVRTYELPFRENNMLRLIAFALAANCYLQSGFAMADEAAKQLVGSWRLTSWVIQVVGGEATEPFGPNPKGRAVFTSDGFSASYRRILVTEGVRRQRLELAI
jgi:hypothetical protein